MRVKDSLFEVAMCSVSFGSKKKCHTKGGEIKRVQKVVIDGPQERQVKASRGGTRQKGVGWRQDKEGDEK